MQKNNIIDNEESMTLLIHLRISLMFLRQIPSRNVYEQQLYPLKEPIYNHILMHTFLC